MTTPSKSWLTVLALIWLSGCSGPLRVPRPVGPDAGPDRAVVRRLLDGAVPSVLVAGTTLNELPAGFDLNPRRTAASTVSEGAEQSLPTKDATVWVGQWRHGAEEVTVRLTPFVDRRRGPGLLVAYEARDAVEWRVPKWHDETTLAEAGGEVPRLIVVGADGRALPGFAPGWCLFVAVSGAEGVVGWSGNPADQRLVPWRAGFRRFRIDGPAGSAGWRLLQPRPPASDRDR